MSDDVYIAAITLGPVGAFIAGGRRSRDLWFGSRFLSEATRWAARTLSLSGEVELILPTLERIDRSFLRDRDQGPTISNKILCRIAASEARVRELLAAARAQAHSFLADEIRGHREQLGAILSQTQLERQAEAIEQGDFVEFHAAWVRRAARTAAAEEAAIQRVVELLDGRKAARLFVVPESEAGRPKCSLEPGWDSVLVEPDPRDRPRDAEALFLGRQRVGIRPDERLSAVGLARRMAVLDYTMEDRPIALQRLPFPPLAQVAADAWLVAARRDHTRDVERIEAAFRRLLDRKAGLDREAAFVLASPARPPGSRGDVAVVFDASVYFEGAIEARRQELARFCDRFGVTRDRTKEHFALLDDIEAPVRALQEGLGVPSPYYALLEADGDGVGEAIQHAAGEARVRLILALYRFADEAWKVIEARSGCAFYVGADELAAYLPLDQAADAARALAALYEREVVPFAPPDRPTSLSVGFVVAHVHEDLRAVRSHASDALKKAKVRRRASGGRDGHLMIYEEPRGGDRRTLAGTVTQLAERLARCERLVVGQRVSLSTAHAVLALHEELDRPQGDLGLALGQAILPLKRRRAGQGTLDLDQDESALLDEVKAAASWPELRELASCLLLAARTAEVARLRRQGGAS